MQEIAPWEEYQQTCFIPKRKYMRMIIVKNFSFEDLGSVSSPLCVWN